MHSERSDSLLIRAEEAYRRVIADPARGRLLALEIADAARSERAREALVVALRAAGWASRELYDHDAALPQLNEAVRVARRAGLGDRLSEALLVRSTAYLELGHATRTRQDLAEARAVAGPHQRPEVTLAEALLEDTVGNFVAAALANRRALDELGDERPELQVKALNNLALLIVRDGRYDEAEALLREALDLAETFSQTFAGFVTESQAIVAIASGKPIVALRRYEEAERRLTAVQAQLVDLYLGKASALLTLRLLDEAADAAERAVGLVEGVTGGSLMLGEALLPQARIALARNDLAQARAVAARAESLFRAQRRTGWRAVATLLRLSAEAAEGRATPEMMRTLRGVEDTMREIRHGMGTVEAGLLRGEVATRLGRRRAAVAAFGRAADAARRGTVLLRLRGRRAAAQRAELLGDTRRLAQICRRGLDELAEYQAGLASVELRTRAAAHGSALAATGLRAALRSGRAEQIWYWTERGHAMTFVRGAARRDDRLQPLLTDLRAQESRLQALPPDAAGDRADVIRRIDALERQIRSISWARDGRRSALTSPSVQALRGLRADLGDNLLLQYGVLDDDVHAVAVTRRGITARALGPISDVTTAARHLGFSLRRLGQRRSAGSTAAAVASVRGLLDQLGSGLVGPFRDQVGDADEVIVVTSGDLMGIPWGVLSGLRDHPVRVAPSATAWLGSRGQQPASDRVVLVAGPGLEEASAEVDDVAHCYDDATVLAGDGATCEEVRSTATGAQLVHVACHGRLRADSPTFSSMQLSDGPLTVHDLEELEMSAHHWILAACDLGSPGALVGPELEGVLAVLLAGGAGAVIAAVVSVPDVSTRHMMIELHRCLAEGRSSARALHAARTAVDLDDPSGFVSAIAFSCYGGG